MMRSSVTLLLLCVVPLACTFDTNPLALPLLLRRRKTQTEGMAYKWDHQTTTREKRITGQESQPKWQNPWITPSARSQEAATTIQPSPREHDTLESLHDQVESRSVWSKKKRRRRAQDDTSYHNIQDSSNSARRAIPPSETLRQRLRIHHSEHNRNLQNDALGTCEEAAVYEESAGEAYGTSCQCLPNGDGNVTMLCADTACHYCNDAWTVCGEYTYGVVFDDEGSAIAFIEQDAYHLGRSDTVVYTDNDDWCTVSINDEECKKCEYVSCANGDFGMEAQCSNLPGGTDYSSCDANFYTDGALQMFNQGAFDVCLQPDTTPEAACLRDAALEGDSECICSEDVDVPGRFMRHCVDPCAYCDDALSTCGREVYDQFYEPIFGNVRAVRSTILYTFGRDEQFVLEETGCEEGYDCSACSAEVNGVQCDSCIKKTCSTAEGDINAAYLDCANIESGGVFDLCRKQQIHIDDGVFQYFSGVITDTCVLESEISCVQARSFFQSPEGGGYECSCEMLADDGSVELNCAITCGEFCNQDVTVCGRESFVVDFDPSGTLSSRRTDFEYSLGRNETLVFEELSDGGCSFSVDSKSCNSCEVRTCTNEAGSIEAPFVDCTNIESGATFDLCDGNNGVQDGIFEYFSAGEFKECIDRTPPNTFCDEAFEFNATAGSTIFGSTELAVFDEVKACVGSTSSAGVWYTAVGPGAGVAVSTCMPETDFKAQISVYSGGCNGLECVARNVGCDSSGEGSASWFADEGVVYHIRVDGLSGETGNFGINIEDLNVSMMACVSKKEEIETISGTKNTCMCENAGLGARLTCVDDCDYCNGDMDVCASETQMWRFTRYGDISREVASHQYSKGRTEAVVFDRLRCNGISDCLECLVTVDDEDCASCDMISCPGATQGLEFDCSNIKAGLANQTTCPGLELATGPFEMLARDEFETCTRDPVRVCETLALAEANSKTSCSCKEYDNSSIALTCDVTQCQFCSDDDTACAVRTYGTTIDHVGEETGKLEGFTYTMGTNERVLIEETTDGSCRVTVDGEKCNSCQIACETKGEDELSDSHGYQIDCENIAAGSSFNTCDSVSQTGTFQVFNAVEFDICLTANLDTEAICLSEKRVKEIEGSRFRKGTSCQCVESVDGAYTLECVDEDCTYCNSNITVCANNTFGVNYNRFGYQVSTFTGMKYVDGGRDQLVVFEDLEGSCSVTVDDQTCNSCEYKTCATSVGANVTGIFIHCENVEEVAIFDECEGTYTPGGLLEVFRSPEFETCHDHSASAKQVCEDLKDEEEDLDPSVACECLEDGAYGDYRLACVYLGCLYCNDERTNCGYEMFATSINRFGETGEYSEGFQYHTGRTDLVEHHKETNPTLGDLGCSMSVNGLECSSCEFVTCLDETGANNTAMSVHCDNVPDGASFNECEAIDIEEGVFEYYSDLEFEQCILVQDPETVCAAAKNSTEIGDPSGGTTCDCASSYSGGYVMSCGVPECQYCNSDRSQCALSDLFGVEFNKFGEYEAYFEAYQYIVGKDHRYFIEETDKECRVAIDAVECTSCSYVPCFDDEGTEYEGFNIDCSNIGESLVFECHEGADLFDILMDTSFGVCIPYNATEAAAAVLLQTTLVPGDSGSDSFGLLDAFDQSSNTIDPPTTTVVPISEPGGSTSTPAPTSSSPNILDSAANELGVRQVLTLVISILISAWLVHF